MASKQLLFHLFCCTLPLSVYVYPSAIYATLGQIQLGMVIPQCMENLTAVQKTTLHSAIWTVQRVNDLNMPHLNDHQLGLTVHQVCSEEDYLAAVFDLFKSSSSRGELLLGVLADFKEIEAESGGGVIRNFADVLKVRLAHSATLYPEVIKALVKILDVLAWADDIEVIAPEQKVLKEFYRLTRREWMCVNRFHLHDTFVYDSEESNMSHPIVFLGSAEEISTSLTKIQSVQNYENQKILLVPLDSGDVTNIKEHHYILQATLAEEEEPLTPPKIIPTTILFEIAQPILQWVNDLSMNQSQSCVNSTDVHCLTINHESDNLPFSPKNILEKLRIESLSSEFQYVLKQGSMTLLTYQIFEDNITVIEGSREFHFNRNTSNANCFKQFDACLLECENFKSFEVTPLFNSNALLAGIRLRPEPWVYAFFSLSLLGIVFCLAVMGFILSRLCKKQILEGNPILTILLLIDVIVMFASVFPFSLEGNKFNRYEIYILRALCVTIPYTFAFALLLSRTVLLATVSSEVGFMSHVAGTVQGFLTLFIFAVQCALSLQLSNTCDNTPLNSSSSLLSLMSYNIVLLILLVFITPLIVKSKRNYREGKHFTVAIILCACAWSAWVPAYAVLDEAWRDPLLCLGLVSTGSIMLGGVFIPRTYMMTVSAARERFTSALPSLATATSAMDIYRASTQPVYDCVNVAAIAAANLRAQHEEERRRAADYYSAPDTEEGGDEEEEEDEFVVQACDSPPIDKVTRF